MKFMPRTLKVAIRIVRFMVFDLVVGVVDVFASCVSLFPASRSLCWSFTNWFSSDICLNLSSARILSWASERVYGSLARAFQHCLALRYSLLFNFYGIFYHIVADYGNLRSFPLLCVRFPGWGLGSRLVLFALLSLKVGASPAVPTVGGRVGQRTVRININKFLLQVCISVMLVSAF